MAKTTSKLALPYPESTDSDNVPKDIKALAEALDALKIGTQAGLKEASAGVVLEASYKDITGASLSITPTVSSILAVTAVFEFDNAAGVGSMKVDAGAESAFVAYGVGTSAQVYEFALSAGAHTVKMRAKGSGNAGLLSRFIWQLRPA